MGIKKFTFTKRMNEKKLRVPKDTIWEKVSLILTHTGGISIKELFPTLEPEERRQIMFQIIYNMYVFDIGICFYTSRIVYAIMSPCRIHYNERVITLSGKFKIVMLNVVFVFCTNCEEVSVFPVVAKHVIMSVS